MDDRFELNGISFVWDRRKARNNVARHGLSFEEAAEAFFDPFLHLMDATGEDEARDAVVGMDERWRLLFVVHVVIEGDRIRIVSARRASRTERNSYEA